MHLINSVVFNLLALRKTVVVPGLGTLGVRRSEAVMEGDTLVFPVNILTYSESETDGGVNLTDYIVEESGLERGDVEHAVKRWVSDVRAASGEDTIFIDGVCSVELKSGKATPSEGLDIKLNPLNQKSVGLPKIKRKKSRPVKGGGKRPPRGKKSALWIVAAVVLAGLFAVYAYRTHLFLPAAPAPEREQRRAAEPVRPEVIDTEPTKDSLHGAGGETTGAPAAVAPEASSIPATAVTTASERLYYVIAGVFTTEDNARRYISQNKEISSSWEIIPNRQGKFMVSAGKFSDNQEATREMVRLNDRLPGVWIYKR